MTDTPEMIALRWEPGAAVTNGPLMDHPDYQRWVREDIAAARVAAAYEAAARRIITHDMGTPMHSPPQILTDAHDQIMAMTDPDAQAALARLLAEAKAEGMREAAAICKGIRKGAETDYYGIGALDCAIAILAAADKVATK